MLEAFFCAAQFQSSLMTCRLFRSFSVFCFSSGALQWIYVCSIHDSFFTTVNLISYVRTKQQHLAVASSLTIVLFILYFFMQVKHYCNMNEKYFCTVRSLRAFFLQISQKINFKWKVHCNTSNNVYHLLSFQIFNDKKWKEED